MGHCAILSPVAAQVAIIVNHLMSNDSRGNAYKHFFLTSKYESLDAAIRLLRHRGRSYLPKAEGRVLIVEHCSELENYFAPLGYGDDLVPNLTYSSSVADCREIISSGLPLCGVVVNADMNMRPEFIDAAECALKHKIPLVTIETLSKDLPSLTASALAGKPDIVVFDESIADNQLPVSICAVSNAMIKPWLMTPNEGYVRNIQTNLGLGLSVAKKVLLDHFSLDRVHSLMEELQRVDNDDLFRIEAHRDYVNPGYTKTATVHGFEKRFSAGHGMRCVYGDGEDNRQIIDCFLNVGTSPRGLNPTDIVDNVLLAHDESRDYWQELSQGLCDQYRMEQAFPAVSNSTANEIAITLALLAQSQKKKTLFFVGGLGFTLITAIGSRDGIVDGFRTPFLPLYENAIFIDPNDVEAEVKLQQELSSGEVGFVWLETLQVDANATRALPAKLIELINRYKEEEGYLIGIDETQAGIMSGKWRHSEGLIDSPDIITLCSVLGDSLLPMGVALATQRVFDMAMNNRPQVVEGLHTRWVNHLSSHIALNCIEAINTYDYLGKAVEKGSYFKEKISALKAKFDFIQDVRGEGLLVTIEFNLNGYSAFVQNSFGYLFWGAALRDPVQGVKMGVCPVHNNCVRYFAPFTVSEGEIDAMVSNMERVLTNGIVGVVKLAADYAADCNDHKTSDFFMGSI